MLRIAELTDRFYRSRARLQIKAGTPDGIALGRVIRQLMTEATLPGPDDTRALMPPTSEAFVRRVPGRNLWLWYVFRGDRLSLSTLTTEPPTSIDD